MTVTLEALLLGALRHSAQIQVLSDVPLVRETAIAEAAAAFDWTSFIETRWDDLSEPVGSLLTTGGPPRFRDHILSSSVGLRRGNTWGGDFEISQGVGFENNNSVFFVPNNQGTAQLTLSYTQPLLRGAGHVYNTSLTVLAAIETEIAQDEFSRQLQEHLLQVTRAYWELYLERGAVLQKKRLIQQASEILAHLESRREIDAVESQIVRARSAVATRRADILRTEFAVRAAEARLRALVNDPLLGEPASVELLPLDHFQSRFVPVDLRQSLTTAFQRRPEVDQALQQIKAASVRLKMSQRELLPLLNVVLQTYASGLQGNGDIGQSLFDQFSVGEPSYSAGLQYEAPIWNRAAKARLTRRRLETRQLQSQFQVTVAQLQLDVEITVNEITTAYRAMQARHRAMLAAALQVEYVRERWLLLAAENDSASLMLEDVLEAQERLADAEFGFLEAGFAYSLAQVNHKKAIGTLLDYNHVTRDREYECGLPRYRLSMPTGGSRSD
jgi:outer membrane protein TolC